MLAFLLWIILVPLNKHKQNKTAEKQRQNNILHCLALVVLFAFKCVYVLFLEFHWINNFSLNKLFMFEDKENVMKCVEKQSAYCNVSHITERKTVKKHQNSNCFTKQRIVCDAWKETGTFYGIYIYAWSGDDKIKAKQKWTRIIAKGNYRQLKQNNA